VATDFIWEEPPPKPSRSIWAERLAPLKERPGQWALIETGSLSRVTGLRSRLGRLAALENAYEFRTHKTSPESGKLYARHVAG
jgi:hypothetical protein